VAEHDHEGLTQALLDWTSRPEALARMALGGANAVAAKFEQGAQAGALEDFYFEALERST
jgi:glycosyltransferase involved in cell wall biosynthesis